MMGMVFGLGSGRCGTKSLAALINGQSNAVCFHEMNPSAMEWEGAEDTVVSLLRDFEDVLLGHERAVTVDRRSPSRTPPLTRLHKLDQVQVIGDVAIYYLPYVELILARAPETRFPCLKRDREEVIMSYVNKLSRPSGRPMRERSLWSSMSRSLGLQSEPELGVPSRNHWRAADDRRWIKDRQWDKCFPSYNDLKGADLIDYVARFYDEYYARAEALATAHPENFKIFDIACLNTTEGRRGIVRFCCGGSAFTDIEVHENQG